MRDLFAFHLCLVRVDSCDFVDRCAFSWLKQSIHEITRIDTKPNSTHHSVAPTIEAKPFGFLLWTCSPSHSTQALARGSVHASIGNRFNGFSSILT